MLRKLVVIASALALAVLVTFSASAQDATAIEMPAGLEPFNFMNALLALFGPYVLPIAGYVLPVAIIGGAIMFLQKRGRGISGGKSR